MSSHWMRDIHGVSTDGQPFVWTAACWCGHVTSKVESETAARTEFHKHYFKQHYLRGLPRRAASSGGGAQDA